MNREIPGYYYDEEKKKYFKVVDSKTAPAQAAWSTHSVKRRLVETKEEELKRERLARNSGRVKRATRIWDEPLMGGCFLAREAGGGPRGTKLDVMRGEAWTMGLRDKGEVKMWPTIPEDDGSITLMYVGGEELKAEGGKGVVLASLNDYRILSSYIPRDEQDDINFRDAPGGSRHLLQYNPFSEPPFPDSMPSSLRYHAPSHMMLATSRWPELSVRIYHSRVRDPGQRMFTYAMTIPPTPTTLSDRKIVNTLTPAPAPSPLICVAGTNMGIVKWQGDNLSWLTSCPPSTIRSSLQMNRTRCWGPRTRPYSPGRIPIPGSSVDRIGSEDNKNIHGEIFSLDFHGKNPVDLIIAGGQSRDICLIDMRCPEREWMASYIRHTSSVAHVKSISEYHILAAGPMNAMAIYDVRFDRYCSAPNTAGCGDYHPYPHNRGGDGSSRDDTSSWGSARGGREDGGRNSGGARTEMPVKGTMPVVQFPEYKNGPHLMQIGFDVLHGRDNSGVGIVAAAHDDGTVGLFSLRSGRKLRSPATDAIRLRGTGNIVKSLKFQTLPGDVHPSLFVGQGSVIKKYSFGMSYSKKGGRVFEDEDWGGEVVDQD